MHGWISEWQDICLPTPSCSVWKMSRGGEKSQEDDLQIVEKEDSMETSQETRREIPDIQFKQEMPEQEEKEEKEAPIDTEEQSDSQ